MASAVGALRAPVAAHQRTALPGAYRSARLAVRNFSPGRRHPRLSLATLLRASWGADVAFTDAQILKTSKAADNLHRLIVDIGPAAAAAYTTPGQFVQAKTTADGKAGFFALASAPDANNGGVVELLIKASGETAEALCAAREGGKILASAPMGKGFKMETIPVDAFGRVYLFATGSGISPIKALIESGRLDAPARSGEVVLYYGTRSPEAMAYADRLSVWEADHGVKVVPVFSGQGEGYVQEAFAKAGGAGDGAGVAAVLCGQKGMTEAVREALTGAGVPAEAILLNF
jgi:NAD(P)H-flavin reductase